MGRGVAGLTKIQKDCGLNFASRFIRRKDIPFFLPFVCGGEAFFMQKNKKHCEINKSINLNVLIIISLFSALSIVLGKFLAISVGAYMRFSLENLPIILSGILFGPICGMLTGIVADLVGCVLRGYEINIILTAGALMVGLISGLVYRFFSFSKKRFSVLLSVILAHAIGSVIIKSIGLSVWYSLDFSIVFLYRLFNYIVVAIVEYLIICVLFKNEGFKKQFSKLLGDKNGL